MNSRKKFSLVAILSAVWITGCATQSGLEGRKTISNCRQIDESGSYILTRNLTGSGDCLGIKVNYVTIDLNGFTLYGNGTGTGVTTYDDRRLGVILKNGNITNFNLGVEMKNVRDATIEHIRSTNNVTNGMRVGLASSGEPSDAIIKDCVAVDNGSADIVTAGIVSGSIVANLTTGKSVIIGNTIKNRLDVNHGVVINNSGKSLLVGNCPTLIMGNEFESMTSLDPPPVFNTDCKVINNIPAGLTSP